VDLKSPKRVDRVCADISGDTVAKRSSSVWSLPEIKVRGAGDVVSGGGLSGEKLSSDELYSTDAELQAPKSLVSQKLQEWISELNFDD
jgi:hypothetical protein